MPFRLADMVYPVHLRINPLPQNATFHPNAYSSTSPEVTLIRCNVHWILASSGILVPEQVVVRVEHAFNFQNRLQFDKRPSVLVNMALIMVQLFSSNREFLIDEPFAPADIGRGGYRTLTTGLSDIERLCQKQQHVVAETDRMSAAVEILKSGSAVEFQHSTYLWGNTVFSLHAVGNYERIMFVIVCCSLTPQKMEAMRTCPVWRKCSSCHWSSGHEICKGQYCSGV